MTQTNQTRRIGIVIALLALQSCVTEQVPSPPPLNSVAGNLGTQTGREGDVGGASSGQGGGSIADSELGGTVSGGGVAETEA